MVKFTPSYTVSYKGVFYRAGTPFEIDESDIDEMKQHGIVKDARPKEEPPRRGRPRKE